MVYDIYCHNDLDGRAAAAVVLSWLRSRGDRMGRLVPLTFKIIPEWLNEDFFKGKRPAIVLDFPYHPGAAMWFDHHSTAFKKPEWQKNFKPDPVHQFLPEYPSCCHMVLDILIRDFDFRPPTHFKELAKWLDVVDGARYLSARQAVTQKEPALRINAVLSPPTDYRSLRWLTDRLSREPLARVAQDPRIRSLYKKFLCRHKESVSFYKKNMQKMGRVILINRLGSSVIDNRYYPFSAEPDINYMITAKNLGRLFKISVGANPWKKNFKSINIGRMLSRYGGGGHLTVGGAEFQTRDEAELAVSEIIAILNK